MDFRAKSVIIPGGVKSDLTRHAALAMDADIFANRIVTPLGRTRR